MTMILVYIKTDANHNFGEEVKVGDVAHTFRGEKVTVERITPPHKVGSTGRVYCRTEDGGSREWFPGVIGAGWLEGV